MSDNSKPPNLFPDILTQSAGNLSKQCKFDQNVSTISSNNSCSFRRPTVLTTSSTEGIESPSKRSSFVRKISNVSSYNSIKFSEPSVSLGVSTGGTRYSSKYSSYAPTVSNTRVLSRPSTFYPNLSTYLGASKPSSCFPKSSMKGSSMYNPVISSKRSCFSTVTVKPSFFSNSLEAFSKQSIYAKGSKVYDTINLAELQTLGEHADSALENWDKWLSIHEYQQEDLSEKLNRPVQCMMMNTSSNSLYTNQDKRDISEASDMVLVDKYRGHPSFWKTDNAVNVENVRLGVYQTIQQKYDRSRQNFYPQLKKIEYVGVPDAILKEKGLSGKPCLPTTREKWNESLYVSAKKSELQQELRLLQEKKPDVSEVAIVGVGLDRPRCTRSLLDNTDSTIESTKLLSQVSTKTTEFELNKTNLVSVVIEDEKMSIGSSLWVIHFDDCHVSETYNKSMRIDNSEDSCLKYFWEIVLPPWSKSDLPLKQVKNKKKCFYFRKNPGAVLPGDKTTILFCFIPSVPGVFREQWDFVMSLSPDQSDVVTVELQGVAVERPDCKANLHKIDAYIEACTRYTIARKAVKEMLDRGRTHETGQVPYDWNFSEEQIFVFNNPNLFYDSKCVYSLKCLHEKVSEGPWDFSVDNLRRDLLEKSNEDLGEDIDLLTSVVVQLMKPKAATAFSSEKYKTIYELLCCFMSKLETDGVHLKVALNIPTSFKQNTEQGNDNNLARKLTRFSSKISPRTSEMSKKSSRKSLSKTKHSIRSLSSSLQSGIESFKQLNSYTNGNSESTDIECTIIRKKQEYLEALFVKTYFNLGKTIDNIVAALESFDAWDKKTALRALKEGTNRK